MADQAKSKSEEEQQKTNGPPASLITADGVAGSLANFAQLTDRFGNVFRFGNAGDYWHPPFPIRGGEKVCYREHVRNIRDLEIRPDDVIICSFPKTGLHWTQEVVLQLLAGKAELTTKDFNAFLDMFPAEVINKLPSPRLLVTHVPFRYVPKQAFEKKIKIIQLERNPKDVLVSYYSHIHAHLPPIDYSGTFEQFFHLYFECGFYYGDLFDYLMEWQRGKEAHPDVDVCVSVFENMKQDPVAGVKKLNDYLGTGCRDQLCEDIAVACSFKKMKVFKDATVPDKVKSMFKDSKPLFYRKGDVGDWKNWFTVAMNEQFDAEFKRRMSGYKLQYKYTL